MQLKVALVVKNPPANAEDIRDVGSIPGLDRYSGGGHSNLYQPIPIATNTPVFLPGEPHRQRSLGRLQSIGSHRVGHD